jgi:excisionase family DNA binding protein
MRRCKSLRLAHHALGDAAMPYTVAEAAKAAGRSKSTLLRAIQAGKLSATRDPITEGWLIEPAELQRAYRVASTDPVRADANGAARIVELEARFEAEQAKNAVLLDQVSDLRRRLDAEAEERRRLTAILADQRAMPARRSWWPWR